jgi:DinB superfamily
MQATELLREQLKEVHQYVEQIMANVTPEQAHWHPAGTVINSLGGNYAHIILAEDLVINAILKGGAPFFYLNVGWQNRDEYPSATADT